MHVVHHRSRSAAPAQGEGDVTSAVRTPIHSPRLARAPSLDRPSFTEATVPSSGIKSAPVVVMTSPAPFSRSRTPDPDFERGALLSRIVTSPPQELSPYNDVAPSPVDVIARRGNERAQAVSRANKLAKMGFAPDVQVLSTGAATPPSHGHGHGHGHKFGFRSLVQSLKGRS